MDVHRIADHSWPVLGPMMRGHAAVYRATGGRVGRRMPGRPPLLLLDHVGATSGKRRTTPLTYMPVGGDFLVVAAKGGHPANPAWLHNLRAHPTTEIQIGSERVAVQARELEGHERDLLWIEAATYNSHWRHDQRRTTRRIPLVMLEVAD